MRDIVILGEQVSAAAADISIAGEPVQLPPADPKAVAELQQRQIRWRGIKRRAEEALARVASGALAKERAQEQRQREVRAKAEAVLAVSQEERETWKLRHRVRRWLERSTRCRTGAAEAWRLQS